MLVRWNTTLGALAFVAATVMAAGQDVAPGSSAVPAPAGRTAEAPVDGLTRKDLNTLSLTLPGGGALELGDFEFEGASVPTNKVHLKLLSPGVYEVTSVAYTVGYWRFRVRDTSSYYGLGERFNALNHTNLGTPDRFVNTPQFGTITEATTPGREIQLSARLSF